MRQILGSTIAVMLVATPAIATTQPQFQSIYQRFVDTATSQGVMPQHVCYSKYCANQMVLSDDAGGAIFLANITLNAGFGLQEFCHNKRGENVRLCAASDGRVWQERNDGGTWNVTKTFATHFDD